MVINSDTMENISPKKNEAYQFMLKYDKNPSHPIHVSRLSVQLFDQLSSLHYCGDKERFYLECAAYVHDVGRAVSDKKHHKHSLRMVMDADWPSFEEQEKLIVANIARYHRKALPQKAHHEFALLSKQDQEIVTKMAAILRVADSLDRSHYTRFTQLSCLIQDGCCLIYGMSDDTECEEELTALNRKKELFLQTFGMDVQLILANNTANSITSEASPVFSR